MFIPTRNLTNKWVKPNPPVNDRKKEHEALKKGVKILYDDVARIPLYNYVPIFAMKGNVDFLPMKRHPFELVLGKNITVK